MLTANSQTPNADSRGFTLLEIIIVIFIISVGLIGILSLVSQNVQVEYVNKNMIIASQLSQEGLELIRNIRDNNQFSSTTNWKTGAGAGSPSDIIQDGEYSIDYTGTIYDTDNINDNLARLFVDANGFYRHLAVPGSATTTAFSRLIRVDTNQAASTTISCLVQWKKGNNTYQYAAQTVFYDWR